MTPMRHSTANAEIKSESHSRIKKEPTLNHRNAKNGTYKNDLKQGGTEWTPQGKTVNMLRE